MANCWNWSVCR